MKKYQFFISSTYLDLKKERGKVIGTILEADQIPAGMELFSAADEEQWKIIQETIDASDYYILIIGKRYGSIFEEGEDRGISYTEKEYNYAVSQGIPVLPYIIDESVQVAPDMVESDPQKKKRLLEFKEKIMKGHTIQYWYNADDLANEVTQSVYKSIKKVERPGYIRDENFNIEENVAEIQRLTCRMNQLKAENASLKMENDRKPFLQIEMAPIPIEDGTADSHNMEIIDNFVKFYVVPVYMADAESGIDYKDNMGNKAHASYKEVRIFRYICDNVIPVRFYVKNDGNAKATEVRAKLTFPNELVLISLQELDEYIRKDVLVSSPEAYENWDAQFFAPDGCMENEENSDEEKFIRLNELLTVPDVKQLLDPAEENEIMSIYHGKILFDKEEVRHQDKDYFGDVYILPTASGKFSIDCELRCNELTEAIEQELLIDVR